MKKNIFVAGHNGMVGSAIKKKLDVKNNVITAEKSDLDLLNLENVKKFFKENRIDEVYLAAAKVGGIYANDTNPVDFIFNNMVIQNNVIHSAFEANIRKLLFLGSSCIYPKFASQPISEECLLTGKLEKTNEPYAIAKISGIKLCESINKQYGYDYRSVMPTNLYGPRDNFHDTNSHVIPALIRRFHEAKIKKYNSVEIWGSGNPKREFLHVDDMAEASIHVMEIDKDIFYSEVSEMESHINIGSGIDHSIREIASIIKEIINYDGAIIFDKTKPDGTPRKLLNVQKINDLGWKSKISLLEGLTDTYDWFCKNQNSIRT